jgi:hypothetical protein
LANKEVAISLESILPDSPVRLSVAAKIFFPDGSMTASGLRSEARKGNLTTERIAGKDYTTATYVEEMRSRCRVKAKEPDFGCNQPADTTRARSSKRLSGSSETEISNEALDAARRSVQKLKRG